jgi:hypothetical protein
MNSHWKSSLVAVGLMLVAIDFAAASSAHHPSLDFRLNLPPPAVMDLSDLDARDAQNRPLRSFKAVQSLRLIFITSFNQRLLQNLTPRTMSLLALLSRTWNSGSDWFRRLTNNVAHVIDVWIQDRRRDPIKTVPVSAVSAPLPTMQQHINTAIRVNQMADASSSALSMLSSTRLLL